MNLVQRLLELVRTLLFGLPESGRQTPDADQEDGSSMTVRNPSPEMWGAILIHARRHRTRRQRLAPAPARDIELGAATPVRAYVLPPDGWARALALSAEEAR